MTRRVVIIGAGIGGLTCAVALKQRGLSFSLYEAAPKLTVAGAGIWLPANAMQVMDRLGVGKELTAAGLPLRRIEVRDRDRQLQVIELERVVEKFGHGTVSIHRAELQRVLASQVPEGALHTGKRCLGASIEGDHATVQFEDGSSVAADVLIGADGLRSAVRTSVFGEGELRYSGQTCYRGVAKMRLPDDLQDVCRETWGGVARFGFSAIGPEQVYWFAPIESPAGEKDEGSAKDRLMETFADFPAPIPDIVKATAPEAFSRLDMYDLPEMETWHRGPVALLGDAVHATTPNLGQGGAQAIESAWVLANCLADEPSTHEAFRSYEKIRIAKARRVAKTSWTFGKAAHYQSGPLRMLRNMLMLSTPDAFAKKQLDGLYSLDF